MSILFYGFSLFFIGFLIHLFVWRIHLPKNHTLSLLYIFFAVFVTGIFIFKRNPNITFMGISVPQTGCEFLQLIFLCISLISFYIVNYPAIEVDSPSLVMIISIARAGKGLDKNLFEEGMDNKILVIPRINDLLIGKFIYLEGGKYRLSKGGFFVARIFILFRNLLGRRELGG